MTRKAHQIEHSIDFSLKQWEEICSLSFEPFDTGEGVVSLKRNAIVLYTFAKAFGGHHAFIPTIAIEDKDFALIMDPVSKDEPDVFEATWDDVPKLLNHSNFPLMLAEFPKESPS